MYRIVFQGQLREGETREAVSARLGKLFRIEDPVRLERLFSGQTVTIKKSLDEAAARRYVDVLTKAGAVVDVEPPLPDTSIALDDFPNMPAEDDLSFRTVMQSFSSEATLPPEPVAAAEPAPVENDTGVTPPAWRRYWPLAAGAGAALLVAAFMLWPSAPAPLAPEQQATLEQLFAIAAEGSDEEFQHALKTVKDADVVRAMHELREAMASVQDLPEDSVMPEFDMERLQALAQADQATFDAAVAAESDVDARRLLLELREAHLAAPSP